MAIQRKKGTIHGKINNLVYRELDDQQIVQIAPKKVKQTNATKLAALEFGLASAQARGMRILLSHYYEETDGKMGSRLNSIVLTCMRTSNKEVGSRTLHDADLTPLRGFQLNITAPIEQRVRAIPKFEHRENGSFHFYLSFNPIRDIIFPPDKGELGVCFTLTMFAFHVFEERIHIIDMKSFHFEKKDRDTELEWECNRELPEGYISLAILSVRFLKSNWTGGQSLTTNKAFYPTIILDAYHVTSEMYEKAKTDQLPDIIKETQPFPCSLEMALQRIERFKEKIARK